LWKLRSSSKAGLCLAVCDLFLLIWTPFNSLDILGPL